MLLRGLLSLLPEVFAITGGILKLVVLAKSERLDPDKEAKIIDVDVDGNVTGVGAVNPMPTPSDVITDLAIGTLGVCLAFDTSILKRAVDNYKLMDKERKDIFWLQMASYGCTFMTGVCYRARFKVKEQERLELRKKNTELAADLLTKDIACQNLTDLNNDMISAINTDISEVTKLSTDLKLGKVVPHNSWTPASLASSILDTYVLSLKEILAVGEGVSNDI